MTKKNTVLSIGNDVKINNNFELICEGEGVEIKKNTLIGANVQIIDSDFHCLKPDQRWGGKAETKKVCIGENVLIGNNVTILKGVKIGDNTVIGNNSVVTKSISKNMLACGNPCKVIREL